MDREGQRVARPAVDLDQLTVLPNPDHGVVNVLLQAGDHDVLQVASQGRNGALEQIVSQRPRRNVSLDAAIDALMMILANSICTSMSDSCDRAEWPRARLPDLIDDQDANRRRTRSRPDDRTVSLMQS